jgi:hypothetical protein
MFVSCFAALVEALMGFQFNHVGGGTKTRRPITLHMKYNSACVQPNCYLITDEFGEQEASLEELQVGCMLQYEVMYRSFTVGATISVVTYFSCC